MLPRVILSNAISLDGRIDGFSVDLGQFYELAARWKEDATLVGSDTILKAEKDAPPEDENTVPSIQKSKEDTRALLVVPDSRGRVRIWHYLKALPYWRDHIALCSKSTPQDYLNYLEKRHVNYIIAGEDRVDLRLALEELNSSYGVKIIRADCGGTLNGLLLLLGLADEVNVVVYPSLVGGSANGSIYQIPKTAASDGLIALKLMHVERLDGDAIWLSYQVMK